MVLSSLLPALRYFSLRITIRIDIDIDIDIDIEGREGHTLQIHT